MKKPRGRTGFARATGALELSFPEANFPRTKADIETWIVKCFFSSLKENGWEPFCLEFSVLVIGLVELLEACKREFAVKIFPVPLDHDLFHVVTFGISCQIGVIRKFVGGEGASGVHRNICLNANSSVKRDMRVYPSVLRGVNPVQGTEPGCPDRGGEACSWRASVSPLKCVCRLRRMP